MGWINKGGFMLIKQPLTEFYAQEAKKVFLDHIKDYVVGLDHMCVTVSYQPNSKKVIDLFNEDKNRNLLMLSPIDKIENHYYNETTYAKYDLGLSVKLYKKFTIYPWTDGTYGKNKNAIDSLKERVYGLYSGHFISLNMGNGVYIVFGIASHCKDPKIKTLFINNLFRIIEAGCAYYSYLKPVMQDHTDFNLPEVSNVFLKNEMDKYSYLNNIISLDSKLNKSKSISMNEITRLEVIS